MWILHCSLSRIFYTISLIFLLIFFAYSEENKNLKIEGKLNFFLNDTDIGWRPDYSKYLSFYQVNNYNVDLNGFLLKDDDAIENISLMVTELELFLKTKLSNETNLQINLLAPYGETFNPKNLLVKSIELEKIKQPNFLFQIGEITPDFSPYSLSHKSFISEKIIFEKIEVLKKPYNLQSLNPYNYYGLLLDMKLNYFEIILVGIRPENEKKTSPIYFHQITVKTENEDLIIALPKEIAFDNQYLYKPYLIALQNSMQDFAQIFFIKIYRKRNNVQENITYLSEVKIEQDRVIIDKKLVDVGDEIYIEWSDENSKAQLTKYLNAGQIKGNNNFLENFTFSYVNLHNDKNSLPKNEKEKALSPMLIEIFSLQGKYENPFKIKSEIAISKYSPNCQETTKDIIGYLIGEKSIDNIFYKFNLRYLGPDYVFNIAPLKDIRYLIQDSLNENSSKNNFWDFEKEYFSIGEKGTGLNILSCLKNGLDLSIGLDYNQNISSLYLKEKYSQEINFFKSIYKDPLKKDNYFYLPTPGLDDLKTLTGFFKGNYQIISNFKIQAEHISKLLYEKESSLSQNISSYFLECNYFSPKKEIIQSEIKISGKYTKQDDKKEKNQDTSFFNLNSKISLEEKFKKITFEELLEYQFIKNFCFDLRERSFKNLINQPNTNEDIILEGGNYHILIPEIRFNLSVSSEFNVGFLHNINYFFDQEKLLTHHIRYSQIKGTYSFGLKNIFLCAYYIERVARFQQEKMKLHDFRSKAVVASLEVIF